MTAVELRSEVADALRVVWPGFEGRYPRVAAYIDLRRVREGVTEHIEEDAGCQHALADLAATEAGGVEMTRLVRGLVKGWLEWVMVGSGEALSGRPTVGQW